MNIPAGLAQHADLLAQRLASPDPPAEHARQAQSLAEGAAGIALLHIERAHARAGSWKTAHLWMKAATRLEVSAADSAGLYAGAPAIAFVLHAAGADGIERYAAALGGLDAHVAALTHRRVDHALARMARGDRPAFAEYDLLHGLTGIGAHLLQHAPGSDALGRILAYLVRLTEPVNAGGESLPGWWTFHDPNVRVTSGGHANLGMAHGIAGQLALLAQSRRCGLTADGHADAIERICAFLDCWQQDGATGHWWPPWVTQADLRAGRPAQTSAGRPSWCYGTSGLARAQQLAAIATGDIRRRRMAEDALARCLSDPAQLGQITDTSLCHGWAGVCQTAVRAAGDALTPRISAHLPRLAARLSQHAHVEQRKGLLQGSAGLALALHTAAQAAPPISGWDRCLMIS